MKKEAAILRRIIREELSRIIEAKLKADPKGFGATGKKLANLAGKGKAGAYGSGWEKSSLEKDMKWLLGHG